MDLTSSDTSIEVLLSETADTIMIASQISSVHQSVPSLPSVFNSKSVRKNYLQRRNQATKQKPRHRKAWNFLRRMMMINGLV